MATTKSSAAGTAGVKNNELVITRIFDAPRDLVWNAWAKPEKMMLWWGPKNFTAPVCKMDFRVGGKYLYCMRSPEGQEIWGTGVYREIVNRQRIVFTDSFADAQGNVASPADYGMDPGFPQELLVTVTFEEIGPGKTKLTLEHAGMPAGSDRDLTGVGWNESFDKLNATLLK